MKCYENPRVADWAVKQIIEKMAKGGNRTGKPHASEIYQCFRRTYRHRSGDQRTYGRKAVLRFAAGFAMQEWFLGPEADGQEAFGVIFSPDRVEGNHVLEFKTTRYSYQKKRLTDRDNEPPPASHLGVNVVDVDWEPGKFSPTRLDSWVLRTGLYCAAIGTNLAHVLVFFLYADDVRAWTFEYSNEDLEWLMYDATRRGEVLQEHLDYGVQPGVATRLGDWECGFCPYLQDCLPELKKDGYKED